MASETNSTEDQAPEKIEGSTLQAPLLTEWFRSESSPGTLHCAHYSKSASLHPGVYFKWVLVNLVLGVTL